MIEAFLFTLLLNSSNVVSSDGPTAYITEQAQPNGWSERGIFVFGEYAIDLQLGLEGGHAGPVQISDCSNQVFFCADGTVFHIVLPKSCQKLSVGTTWEFHGVRTEVLGQEDVLLSPHLIGSGVTWYLGDESRPSVVYEYDPDLGIKAIYFDSSGEKNFVEMARANTLEEFKKEQHKAYTIERYYKYPRTFDLAGACI